MNSTISFQDDVRTSSLSDEVQSWLISELAAITGVSKSQIDPNQSIARYGVDSLMYLELIYKVSRKLGVTLPQLSFFPSITELASRLLSDQGTRRETAPASYASPEPNREYPLSYSQQSLYYLHQLAPESTAYNIVLAFALRDRLDPEILGRAFQLLNDRHPQLRARFSSSSGGITQVVTEKYDVAYTVHDAENWTSQTLRARLVEEAHRPFNLENGPVLRVHLYARSGEHYIVLMIVHHIVSDLWSLAVLTNELGTAYSALENGETPALPKIEADYADYVRWQAEMLAGQRGERLRDYWRSRLTGKLPVLNLPTDFQRPAIQTYRGSSIFFSIDKELSAGLRRLARDSDATMYMILLAAIGVLLFRYTGHEDLIIGSPAAGRSRAEMSGVVGYFVNLLPFRIKLSRDMSFTELLREVREIVLGGLEHQDYPLSALVEDLRPERDQSRSPLFDVAFAFQKPPSLAEEGLAMFALGEPGAKMALGGLTAESLELESQIAQFDLSFTIVEMERELRVSLRYNVEIFRPESAMRMAGHFRTLIRAVVDSPEALISALNILSLAERHAIVTEWEDTSTPFDVDFCVHTLFERQAERQADAVALADQDKQLTYCAANSRANQMSNTIARILDFPSRARERRVGICMERSLDMVVAVVAVLKAGAAYVPIDPSYPKDRQAFMLDDCRAALLLTTSDVDTPFTDCPAISLDRDALKIRREDDQNVALNISADELAYIIYTSGSTGAPKGAMNTHRAIANRLLWMQDFFGLDSSDSVLQKTPFSFDVSVWELLWPLITGARLVIAKPGGHQDPAYLLSIIASEYISTVHFVPSMLRLFLDINHDLFALSALKRVIASGEALTKDLETLFFSKSGAELHNLYGPTEAAVDVSYWTCDRESERTVVPIGRPIANVTLDVLDDSLEIVPLSAKGELMIGGVAPGRGYFNRPELTAEKFVPDPVSTTPGQRIYRTGDLATHSSTSDILYLGRKDNQVKVRGFRIELGEIEAALQDHHSVKHAVVVTAANGSDQRLLAYVTGPPPDQKNDGLKEYLASRLPEYMVPNVIVPLESLPLLPNGKVDRHSLPQIDSVRTKQYQPPETPTQMALADMWMEVLKVDRIGVSEDFFEAGGNSLSATKLVTRINHSFDTSLQFKDLFGKRTIAGLATLIEEILIQEELQAGSAEL